MKTIKFMNRFLSVLGMVALILSCSPEDGADGMDGADGINGTNGTNGADGADGAQGEQGDTGTANVIYSEWVNTELGNSIMTSSASFEISAPQINTDMLNEGTILVYARRIVVDDGGNLVYQLPIVFGAGRQQSYYFRAEVDAIRITVVANQEGENVNDGSFLEQYRYVLIPGGVPASNGIGGIGSKTSAIDYTKMSYEELSAKFNIPD